MSDIKILWADDEIDLLKPHVLFLQEKGYEVSTVTNGNDALEAIKESHFDLVFLDENMPGLTGLETLSEIKNRDNTIPIVLITKNEEEHLMEEAIGSRIDDYLIKPVNPRQILLTIKKIIDNKKLVSQKTTAGYQVDFRNIAIAFNDRLNLEDWMGIYKKLVYWELELENSDDENMHEILTMQKKEANTQFSKFIENQYFDWVNDDDAPVMSNNVMRRWVFPEVKKKDPVYFILIDNLRYDQWKIINPLISEYFRIEKEELFMSILPTATQYSRNSIFSGLMPSDMAKMLPQWWKNDEDDGGKNQFEKEFLEDQVKRLRKDFTVSYNKILNNNAGKQLVDSSADLKNYDLNAIVFNFVDMLSHARTDSQMIRELASDEAAYRSITLSWFEHSPLFELLKKLSKDKAKVIVTTDHGTIKVKSPSKVKGDRNTSTNLRYKHGKSLDYVKNDVFAIAKPEEGKLPKTHFSSQFIFAKDDSYFIYPNDYHKFVNYFKNTFQHGGISLEEVFIPFVTYTGKG